MFKKWILSVAAACLLAGGAKACPPGMQFGGFSGFNFCPQATIMSFDVVDVPSVQLVPQVTFQRQFIPRFQQFSLPQQFSFPVNPCASQLVSLGQFSSPYGASFNSFGGNFGGFNGRGASFRGDRFEFQGGGNRLNVRENPRGGVRLRSR